MKTSAEIVVPEQAVPVERLERFADDRRLRVCEALTLIVEDGSQPPPVRVDAARALNDVLTMLLGAQ